MSRQLRVILTSRCRSQAVRDSLSLSLPLCLIHLLHVFLCALRRAEGPQMLYRGLGPALLRAFPLHALVFVAYETTIKILASSRAGNTQHKQALNGESC